MRGRVDPHDETPASAVGRPKGLHYEMPIEGMPS